jgi:hypothetical protein
MKHPKTVAEAAAIRDATIADAYAAFRKAVVAIKMQDGPMKLGVRARNRLKNLGLSEDDPAGVAKFGRKKLMARTFGWGDNFGKKSLTEIEVWLAQHGLELAP